MIIAYQIEGRGGEVAYINHDDLHLHTSKNQIILTPLKFRQIKQYMYFSILDDQKKKKEKEKMDATDV